jgi:hypothetical protein
MTDLFALIILILAPAVLAGYLALCDRLRS